MKKRLFRIVSFLSVFLAYSTDLSKSNPNQELQPWQQEISFGNPVYENFYRSLKIIKQYNGMLDISRYYYTDKVIKGMCATIEGQINYLTDMTLNNNGFITFNFNNKEYFFIPHHFETIMYPVGFIPDSMTIELQKENAKKARLYPEILNVKASSFLTEKTRNGICEYTPEFVEDYFPYKGIILPWVEGANGDGIAETLEFDVGDGTALYILNGYVDPAHPELYKNNGRIKKAKFQVLFENGKEEIVEVDFMDFVYCKEIKFSGRLKHVKIIIEDVYPGEKYKDTCISRIFTNFSYSL